MTDVGNDLLYGVAPEKLLTWVEQCLDRLLMAGAETLITELPLASLATLGEARFRFFRRLLFPRSGLTLAAARKRVAEVNEGLLKLAASRKLPVIPASSAWYGFDPIHIRRQARHHAWPEILAGWRGEDALPPMRAPRLWERLYLARLAPYERYVFGARQRASQPSGRLADGTTISLY